MITFNKCTWYDDQIKNINKQIWYPDNVSNNNNIKYPFNSHTIDFKSFINSIDDKSNIKITTNHNKTHKNIKRELTEKYFHKCINSAQKFVNDSANHLKATDSIKKFTNNFKLMQLIEIIKANQLLTQKDKFSEINKIIKSDLTEKYFAKCINCAQKFVNDSANYLKATNSIEKFTDNFELTQKDKLSEINQITQGKVNMPRNKLIIPTDFLNINNMWLAKKNKVNDNFNKQLTQIGLSIHSFKSLVPFNNKQKQILLQWFDIATIVYNKCVDCFNSNDPNFPSNFMTAKLYIFDKLFNENNKMKAPYDILSYEVKTFFENVSSCYSNLANNNINKFQMKYKNVNKDQTITLPKSCMKLHGIYVNLLGNVDKFSNYINTTKFDCDCKLTYDKVSNNFYLYIPQYIKNQVIANRNKICAIDPGEKVPFTYYSLNDYGFIGNDIRVRILKNEAKIRKLQRLLKKVKTKKGNRTNKCKLKKKINKEYRKIKGLVNELHKKAALYFCRNYNIILIPVFSTQSMVCDKQVISKNIKHKYETIKTENKENITVLKQKLKEYKRVRRLNSRVKFVLNQLSHYKFKQHLFAKAKEYGCLCVEVTEEFTSQLCTVCGNLDKKYIGRMKTCTHCKSEINRDINGSRNILLKNICSYLH